MTDNPITDTTPKPGSDDAISMGCTCPVLDNARGLGRLGDGEKFGWWYNMGCPVHFETGDAK